MMFSLALLTAALAQVCDEANNDASNNDLNPDCNNAGICSGGSCICCDVLTCHPFWVDYPAFAGDTCTTVNRYYFANWGILIRPIDDNEDLGFTCDTNYYAFIANQTVDNLELGSVDMSTQMASTMASSTYGNYGGLTQQVGCLECSEFTPCLFSIYGNDGTLVQQINYQEGFGILFMTDYNTYYNPECATTEQYWDFAYTTYPPDCPDNKDYGFAAQDNFKQAGGFYNPANAGFFDAATIGALFDESIARGTFERPPGLGLDNVYTFDVVAQSENYEPVEGVIFDTRQPTNNPTAAPTKAPNNDVLVCSEAMWFIADATHDIPDETTQAEIATIISDAWIMSDLEWSVNGVDRSVYYSLYPYTKFMWYELVDDTFIAAGHENEHATDGAWNIKMGSSTTDPTTTNFTAEFYNVIWDSSTYVKVEGFPATDLSCPEDSGVHWEYFCDACGGWLSLSAHEEVVGVTTTTNPADEEEPMMDGLTDPDTVCADTININTNTADFDSTDLAGDFTRVAGGFNLYPAWTNGDMTVYWDSAGTSYTDTGNWAISNSNSEQLYTLPSNIKSFCLTFDHINTWTDVVNGGDVDIRFYDQGGMPACRTVSGGNTLTYDTLFGQADFCDTETPCTNNGDCDSESECCFNGCALQCMALETDAPTKVPSKAPTEDHVDPQTCIDEGYTNSADDVEVVGLTTEQYGCRGGLEDWWQGGMGCWSPYVVCLPQENTPNGFYHSDEHRYSIDECKAECALDQHCLGAEFKADLDADGVTPLDDYLGSCTLFLSIPSSGWMTDISQGDFDAAAAGAPDQVYAAYVCMNKVNECNPSFSGDELNAHMLECYCPNNRKGTYTKEVTRTVETAVHCGGDSDATASIQKALANRMFEMCESWCLFDFDDPMNVAWFYDPWESCYREQYSSPGPAFHTLYCDAVVRDPYTVEIQYIHLRSMTACDGNKETTTAVTGVSDYTWVMSGNYESCTAACARTGEGMLCDPSMTNSVDETMAEATVDSYFLEAQVGCNSTLGYITAEAGQPAPAYSSMTGECLVFNTATSSDNMPSCNAAVAATYMRLCACYE